MSGLLSAVYNCVNSGCLRNGKLRKQGCTVALNSVPSSRLIIDFDKPGSPIPSTQTQCDYLVLVERCEKKDIVALLELKKGALDTSKVYKQLTASARTIENLVDKDFEVCFLPVVACGGTRKGVRDVLRQADYQICFHGHTETVRVMRCGGSLSGVEGF